MFSGMTRSERWLLLGFILLIGIGLAARDLRESRGQRVFELVEGRKPRELTRSDGGRPDAFSVLGESEGRSPVAMAARLNLNKAAMTELMRLRGIGETRARAIVEDRRANGPFASVYDLTRVSGIGLATVEALLPFVTVDDEAAADGTTPPGPGGLFAPEPGSGAVSSGSAAFAPSVEVPASATPSSGASSSILPFAPPDAGSPPAVVWPGSTDSVAAPAASHAPPSRIDINRAGVEELMRLDGIGEVRARAIVEYRQRHGPFRRVEDLIKIPGIGIKTLEKNRASVTVD